ncbi:hypothetical protein ABIA33_000353 [Streptacidiphilus sp. MAP12-16]
MGTSLLIGPVDRRTDLSREMERANTHNELAGYRHGAARVKTARSGPQHLQAVASLRAPRATYP